METRFLSLMKVERYWYAEHEKLVRKFKESRGGGWLMWPT